MLIWAADLGGAAMRLLSVFGTRPEAVKMAPILRALAGEPGVESLVCVTGQHREMLDCALRFFAILPDFDLDLMEPAQALNSLAARAIERLDRIIVAAAPDRVIVQGDTTTALAAALAAYQRGVPVAHVEAGLRTYAPHSPWPEELNRRAIDLASDLHLAPTAAARANLVAERLHGEVYVTGNSGIDALLHVAARLADEPALRDRVDAALPALAPGRRLVLVTLHRRESLGEPLLGICEAIAALADRGDVEIVFPVHPNPEVGGTARAALGGRSEVHLLPPLEPVSFVRAMQRAEFVVTDSGGVQEEAVALEKPVLVVRDVTERPEAVEQGAARLIGTHGPRIARLLSALLDDPAGGGRFARRPLLFGDGRAAQRIVDALLCRPVEEFAEAPRPAPALVTAAAE